MFFHKHLQSTPTGMYGKKLFIEEEAVPAAKNQDSNSSAASRNGALRVAHVREKMQPRLHYRQRVSSHLFAWM